MQLSKRLTAVAESVSKGITVADIGCDHGYVSIFLVKQGIADLVIAMDINQGPLRRAEENMVKYQCQDRVKIRLSDGAKALNKGEVHTILMAGMGGALMIKILSDSISVIETAKELILQPQSEIERVRRYLHDNHFLLLKETMLLEDGKYYTIIKAGRGKERYHSKREYRYGKLLIEENNPCLKDYLFKQKKKFEAILKQMKEYGAAEGKERYQGIQCDYQIVLETLEYLTHGRSPS